MQVVIRMQDVAVLAEVVDAVEDGHGFRPENESTDQDWAVATYDVEGGAKQAVHLTAALLEQAEARGLLGPNDQTYTEIKII